MIFGYATLFIAFILSIVAAYYSILGLTAIFAAAVVPIIIMGAALETGKVITAMWLHRNWKRSPWTYKAYLLPSLIVLMLLTSMGIFGFLSKAHLDQTVPTGDVAAQVALFDEKIKIERETIENSRSLLQQLDRAVVDLANAGDREIKLRDGTTRTQSAAERSLQIRRSQAADRAILVKNIDEAQKNIVRLQQEKAPIASQLRTIEAEVGPVKYIAALIYGENPDHNTLERAVRWVIILLVIVFDPLAIILILAGTRHIEWARQEKKNGDIPSVAEYQFEPDDSRKDRDTNTEDNQSNVDQRSQGDDLHIRSEWEASDQLREDDRSTDITTGLSDKELDDIDHANRMINEIEKEIDYDSLIEELKSSSEANDQPVKNKTPEITHNYLNLPFKNFGNLKPMVFNPVGDEIETKDNVDDDPTVPEFAPIMQPVVISIDDDDLKDEVTEEPPVVEEPEVTEEPPVVEEPEVTEEPPVVEEPEVTEEPPVDKKIVPHYRNLNNDYFDIEGKTVHARVLPDLYPEVVSDIKKQQVADILSPKADNIDNETVPSKATFGTEFPSDPEKGEMFLNVASLPSRLYKFNGFKWIVVDKSIADSYTYNEDYLQYLVDKIELGHFNPDDLTASEQDQITEYLKKNDE